MQVVRATGARGEDVSRRAQPLILLVEDSDNSYELHSELLAQAGYAIVGAGDSEQAFEAATRLEPDLIMIDLATRTLETCTAARLLKRNERTGRIPILALTSDLQEDFFDAARAAGCDAFLAKPCHISRLLDEIGRQVQRAAESGGLRQEALPV